MATSFYTEDELKTLGLKQYGKNVLISRKSSIYNAENISIGNNVRIDDFSLLSGHIVLGDYTHVSAYSSLFAGDSLITMEDYSSISSYVCIYAVSDDYSGKSMANPTIPEEYKKVKKAPVKLCKYVLVGTGSKILPGVEIREGTSVGAMSLITKSTEEWMIYFGIPAKPLKKRSKKLLEYEKELRKKYSI